MQRCWYCLSTNSIPRFSPFRELNDSFRQFLDKQRYAIGAAGDLIENRLRKSAGARNAGRDRPDCGVPQPIEHEPRDHRMSRKCRLSIRTAREQHHHARAVDPVQPELKHFQRGRVYPVCVLNDNEHRL